MKKGIGYYMKSYLKNNALVLFFELIVIVLLALVCTVLLGGQPVWLGPVMALVAYLLAEMRFMMAYVASNANKDAKEQPKEAEETEEDDLFGTEEEDENVSYDEYTPPAPIPDEPPTVKPFPPEVPNDPAREATPDGVPAEGDLDDEPDLPARSTLDLGE